MARGSVKCCVRQGGGCLITQCCGWGCWAGSGPSFCTASQQNPLLPPLIVWWTCGSERKPKPSCQLHTRLFTSATGDDPQWNNNGHPGTHHQEFQDCSFRRVFDQTARAHTHTQKDKKLNADFKTAAVISSQILPKHQISLDMFLQRLQQTQGSVVDHIIGVTVTHASKQSTPGSAWVARSENAAHHFDTKSWKSLEKTPSGSLGGGWVGIKRSGSKHEQWQQWGNTVVSEISVSSIPIVL